MEKRNMYGVFAALLGDDDFEGKCEKNAAAQGSGTRPRVFDWDKAARLLGEKQPKSADAGLLEDQCTTRGCIWEDGKPFRGDYTYLYSTWATPVLFIGKKVIECWAYADEAKWDESTKWPKSALSLLKKAKA